MFVIIFPQMIDSRFLYVLPDNHSEIEPVVPLEDDLGIPYIAPK